MAIGTHELAYAILHTDENRYIGIEHHSFSGSITSLPAQVEGLIKASAVLNHEFRSVSIAFCHHQATLIPAALFDPNKRETYLHFNHASDFSGEVRSDQLANLDCHNIYYLPAELEYFLSERFPQAKLLHHATSLLEAVAIRQKNSTEKRVFLQYRPQYFDLLVFNGKNLVFHNTFYYQANEDILYYLLFAADQLELNPESMLLEILGPTEKSSALVELIRKYVRHVELAQLPDHFKYSKVFNQVPAHFFVNLLNQYLCV